MWIQPKNIPADDWIKLTQAWDARKGDVHARFTQHAPVTMQRIDAIMAGLLGIYYRTEQHVNNGAGFETQLKDEFHKGHLVDAQIVMLKVAYPQLEQKAQVRYQQQFVEATLADKCMGGIVKAFIEITAEVCTETFGRPYKDKLKALRNGVLERSSWETVLADYDRKRQDYYRALKADPDAPAPVIYRQ